MSFYTCALSCSKVGKNEVKQLAEHIEFKPAETIKEAKQFTKDNFGMELELDDNLFAANLINDISTNINNKMKGKAKFPRKAIFYKFSDTSRAAYNPQKDFIEISIDANGGTFGNQKIDSPGLYNKLLTQKYSNIYTDLIKHVMMT